MLGLEAVDTLPSAMIDPDLAAALSVSYLKQKNALPIRNGEKGILIAISDPFDYETIDYITQALGKSFIETILAPEHEIGRAINKAFEEGPHTAEQVLRDIDEEDSDRIFAEIEETTDLLEDTSEAPVIKFVNLMFSRAAKSRASDIHIEPYQHDLKIRFRVDGLLYETFNPPKRLHPSITSRIKVMAGLNIAEKRMPQDGRIEIKVGDRNIDIRVSTLPTVYGERVVLRLLDKSSKIFALDELGIPQKHLKTIKELITLSHGIVLVTGPTSSSSRMRRHSSSSASNCSSNISTLATSKL